MCHVLVPFPVTNAGNVMGATIAVAARCFEHRADKAPLVTEAAATAAWIASDE